MKLPRFVKRSVQQVIFALLVFPIFTSFLFTPDVWGQSSHQTVTGLSDRTSAYISPELWALTASEPTSVVLVLKAQGDGLNTDKLPTKEAKGEAVYATLRRLADETQGPLKTLLQVRGISFESFWIVNCLVAKIDSPTLALLAQHPDIAQITANRKYLGVARYAELTEPVAPSALEWGLTKIQADKVWALGVKGAGVVIGGLDTGYQWDHPALKSKYRGWNGSSATHDYNWYDGIKQDDPNNTPNGNPCGINIKAPCDDDKHGTHTMGTMVGADGANEVGVAPEAKWVGCRNMERGWGMPQTYLNCFQWMLAPTDVSGANPNPAKAPHVINNSWYCSAEEGCKTLADLAPLETAVNNLKNAGIVVVVSAGNAGSACGTVQNGPAIFANSFSVGATDVNDAAASFSSRGPVTIDGSNRQKPDIAAPGAAIRSTIPNNGYGNLSGTSMAGPHVAGLVALMISAKPWLAGKVTAIEQLIRQNATPLTSTQTCGAVAGASIPNAVFGYGRIDALKTVQQAMATSIEAEAEQIESFTLSPAYPNPFNPETRFSLTVAKDQTVKIYVYNALGQKVQTVFEGLLGAYQTKVFQFKAQNLNSGLYFIRAEGQGQLASQSVLLAK